MHHYTQTNGINLAYLDTGGNQPPLVLLHGLTANAYQFGGLLRAGLADTFRVIAPDLRGRGRSDKPTSGYTMADHAADVVGLLDALNLTQVALGGHSFGGMLALYMSAYCPERLHRLILLDAALSLAHPSVLDAIQPVLERLEKPSPSMDDHLGHLRELPMYAGAWDEDMAALYRADVETLPDGRVRSRSTAAAIQQASEGVLAVDWTAVASMASLPTMLVRGAVPYNKTPLLGAVAAQETLQQLPHGGTYHEVDGNHMTMLFGGPATQVAAYIAAFAR